MKHTDDVILQIERNYHRLTLQFPVSVDCLSVVAAVGGKGNVVVATVDNDYSDLQRLYKYVRIWFWPFLLHNLIDVHDLNYSAGMIVEDDDVMNFVHKSFVFVTVIVAVVNVMIGLCLL